MKTFQYMTVLSLLLACAVLTLDARLDRGLKERNSVSVSAGSSCVAKNGNCFSSSSVTSKASDDVAKSISTSLTKAVAAVEDGEDVDATAFSFAQAVAEAFATIISNHKLTVYSSGGGSACAFSRSDGGSSAFALSKAVSSALAESSNGYANAAADCFSEVVSSASVTAFQRAHFKICTSYGYESIFKKVVTIGYVKTIATAFSQVLTAIKDNNAEAAANCGSSGTSTKGVTTSVFGG